MLRLVRVLFLLLPLCCRLPHCAAEEPRQWPVEWQVGRFSVHADFPLGEPQDLANELSEMTADLTSQLKLLPSDRLVHIVLFQSAREYNRYMQTYFPALPQRRAWFLQDRGPGMLFTHWHADVAIDLRHEITHAILNDGNQPLPLWLDEGLAEYFELPRESRYAGNQNLVDIADRARQGYVPSLQRLESVTDLNEFSDAHYRDSWSWVHFLMHRSEESRNLLTRFINGRDHGVQPMPLSRQLIQIVPDINGEYQAHFLACAADKLSVDD